MLRYVAILSCGVSSLRISSLFGGVAMAIRPLNKKNSSAFRRGVAVSEFAIVAPVVTVFILGLCEMGQALSGATRIASAIREGGRLASMDFSGKLEPGQTANQKVTQDILSFLAASGVGTDNVQVTIVHEDGPSSGTPFDLAATANYLELFRIEVTVPYANISANPINIMDGLTMSSATVFRRGRTPID